MFSFKQYVLVAIASLLSAWITFHSIQSSVSSKVDLAVVSVKAKHVDSTIAFCQRVAVLDSLDLADISYQVSLMKKPDTLLAQRIARTIRRIELQRSFLGSCCK